MKKLSELKISPAPWKLCRDGDIVHGNGYSLMDGDGCFVLKSDARITAASPDMYDALWDLLFGDIGTANCRKCKGAELGNCKTCHLGKAREAMEKACGIEVTHEETK